MTEWFTLIVSLLRLQSRHQLGLYPKICLGDEGSTYNMAHSNDWEISASYWQFLHP